jgi:hypothetical protein
MIHHRREQYGAGSKKVRDMIRSLKEKILVPYNIKPVLTSKQKTE